MRNDPDPIDIHVGGRVRNRRKQRSMSQTTLGKILGITFQQVQKYERGTNRIGSSRMFRISEALEVEVGYFFEGLQPPAEPLKIKQAIKKLANQIGDLAEAL